MTIDLSVNTTGGSGSVNYSWSRIQTAGAGVAGTSIVGAANTASFTYPSTMSWLGANATTGQYAFTVQATAVDTKQCSLTKTIVLYFDSVCTINLTNFTIV